MRIFGKGRGTGQPPTDDDVSWAELEKKWDDLSEAEQAVVQQLQERAAEEQTRAEQLEQAGDLEGAEEARRKADHFLTRAREMLGIESNALDHGREVETYEREMDSEAHRQLEHLVRDHLPDVQAALSALSDAIQVTNALTDERRQTLTNLCSSVTANLESSSTDRSIPLPIPELQRFLRDAQQIKTTDVRAAWRAHASLLDKIV